MTDPNSFSQIIGQEKIIKTLTERFQKKKLAHALLFSGPSQTGKRKTALALMKLLCCLNPVVLDLEGFVIDSCGQCKGCLKFEHGNHPDVKTIAPEESFLKIGQIRGMQDFLTYSPLEAEKKTVLILKADRMTEEAANSFLKTLEEPPLYCLFILVTDTLASLLPTIISRCQIFNFSLVDKNKVQKYLTKEFAVEPKTAKLYATLSEGRAGKAVELAKGESESYLKIREDLMPHLLNITALPLYQLITLSDTLYEICKERPEDFFNLLIYWYRDILILKKEVNDKFLFNLDVKKELLKTARSYNTKQVIKILSFLLGCPTLVRRNINLRYLLDSLVLRLTNR